MEKKYGSEKPPKKYFIKLRKKNICICRKPGKLSITIMCGTIYNIHPSFLTRH